LDEQTPTPEDGEVVVFRDFFTCGLRFPYDPILPAILEAFSVKIHQLLPTSFLEMSKFIWIMKTFGCNLSVDAFARFFELVVVPDVIKVNDGQFYEAHQACWTFNTRRQNTRRGITRIQIVPCCKTNLNDDWNSYWFYVNVDMSKISGYEGPAHPLSSPILALTTVNTAEFNHRVVGIRSCENAFHLASTILGGRDIVEEFVAAHIWPISYGWAPSEIVHFNVNWASQEVPFPKFGIKLREGQSANDFMLEVEKRVTIMIGEYTMNEYKAYKALVKHKRKINRVFSEVCGDKAFPSRRPGRKLKIPAVAVASCLVAPPNAPRRRSSKSGPTTADETTTSGVQPSKTKSLESSKRKRRTSTTADETTTSGVQPSKTKSLESSKRKRRTSEQVSDAELQAASSLAQMSHKKSKKAVKKVVSSGVRRVPSAFDDDLFVEPISQKGSFFWPMLRFDFHDRRPSSSENEFVDIDSFSDSAPEVQKEVIPDGFAGPPVVAADSAVPQPFHPHEEASSEFVKELELTIHRGEDPVEDAPLLDIDGENPST
jgi:hypothetical protein